MTHPAAASAEGGSALRPAACYQVTTTAPVTTDLPIGALPAKPRSQITDPRSRTRFVPKYVCEESIVQHQGQKIVGASCQAVPEIIPGYNRYA